MKVCVITDNEFVYNSFKNELIVGSLHEFHFFYSETNKSFKVKYEQDKGFKPIMLKNCDDSFFAMYDLFISLHCKQIFPGELVNNHRCINIHPGLNPYNRGWYPQVFSIINKKPVGVTIHEMDEELDHGAIIFQRKLGIDSWETSIDVYRRVLDAEIDLLREHLEELITNQYTSVPMKEEGNINYKVDFDSLCRLDLDDQASLLEHIDLLRALTFTGYDNAYFYDEKGNKVFVTITLKNASEKLGGVTPNIYQNAFIALESLTPVKSIAA